MELLRLLGKDTSGLPCLSPHGFTSAPRRRSPPKAHRPRAANKAAAKVGALGNCIRWLFWGQKWLGISLIRQNTQIESRRLDLGFLYCSLSGNENRLAQDDEGRVSLRSISENTLVSMVRGLQRLQVHGPRSFDKCVSGTAAITSTIENTYITRFPCAAFQSLRHLAPGNHICFLWLFHFSRISCIWHFLLSIFWESSTWLPILVCPITLISSIPLYTSYNLSVHVLM